MSQASSCARALCLVAAAALAPGAHAGTFSVSPVRIFMEARERATGVTIENEGDSPLVMQAELFDWSQTPEGKDKLDPTNDLVLAPPILKLAPHSRQVVRLANLRPVPAGDQRTYRLIVREVPEALAPTTTGVRVQVALAFSLPIFITPPGAKRALACTATRSAATTVTATCENTGRAYAEPANFTLTGADGATLLSTDVKAGYVLPGVKRSFELTGTHPLPAGPARMQVTQDDGSKQIFDVQLAE
jgi:fimbrial chaperone protein